MGNRAKRKQAKLSKQNNLLLGIGITLIVVLLGGWVIFKPSPYSDRTQVACEITDIPNYPPAQVTLSREEASLWSNPELENMEVSQKFTEIVQMLSESNLPIMNNAGRFLWDSELLLGFNSGIQLQDEGVNSVMAISQDTGTLFININSQAFVGPDRFETTMLGIGIVHEALHAQEIAASESITDTIARLPTDYEYVICGEMRAMALQTALYYQLNLNGYTNLDFDEDLEILQELDWKWDSVGWRRYLNEVYLY